MVDEHEHQVTDGSEDGAQPEDVTDHESTEQFLKRKRWSAESDTMLRVLNALKRLSV